MFPRRYFAGRYFAPRYFPGESLVPPGPSVVSEFNWLDSDRNELRSGVNYMTSDDRRLRSKK